MFTINCNKNKTYYLKHNINNVMMTIIYMYYDPINVESDKTLRYY